jgi:precorrin-2 dehydrogenase / sirohydrochlorin ferrochelatase
MKYYPVNLDIRNRSCLVVGGGAVATRKVQGLLDCGARVTVVSPRASDPILAMVRQNRLQYRQRPYQAADLETVFLVIGATDDETTNRRIASDAEALNLLCNIADRPQVCNFILPAVVHRGDLIIAVSTSGASPALAKNVRRELERQYGPEYADLLRLMAAIRKRLLSTEHAPEAHKPLFEQLIRKGLPELVKRRQHREIRDLLRTVLGSDMDADAVWPSAEQQ